jgi:hypothetical protein
MLRRPWPAAFKALSLASNFPPMAQTANGGHGRAQPSCPSLPSYHPSSSTKAIKMLIRPRGTGRTGMHHQPRFQIANRCEGRDRLSQHG